MKRGINHILAGILIMVPAGIEFLCYYSLKDKDDSMAMIVAVIGFVFLGVAVNHIVKGILLIKNDKEK